MYADFFGLRDNPFSITPDPRYLFMSPQHREALAHLVYGIGENGGFVQLTGEVGTGKTTLIRTLLEQHLENVDVALCLNPRLTVEEFVATICDELHIDYPRESYTLKPLVDRLNAHLLHSHAQGRRTVLIIDEAQNLSREVLEQVRLLTNLETHRHKLLHIILVGQPELQTILGRQDLRQLAQRITARYHLQPLNREETRAYIRHRLQVAGGSPNLFTASALRTVHRLADGIPRLLNVICDRALLGAYSNNQRRVKSATVRRAAAEAVFNQRGAKALRRWGLVLAGTLLLSAASATGLYFLEPTLLTRLSTLAAKAFEKPATTQTAENPQTPPPSQPEEQPKPADQAQNTESADTAPAIPAPGKPAETTAAIATPEAAPPPPLPPQPALASLFDSTAGDPLGELLKAWQEDPFLPSGVVPCEYLKARALRCLNGRGNWDELRRFNHPAVIRLANPKGGTQEVLLRSLEGEAATLVLAGKPVQVDLPLLDLLWTGNYLLLWRLQCPVDLVGPGSHGETVGWLRHHLALADGASQDQEPLSDYYDAALRERVLQFQRAHGLQPDGLVGARTMIYLNQLTPMQGTPYLTPPVTRTLQ